MPIKEENSVIRDHKFSFRTKYSTVDQVRRITSVINKLFEAKMFYLAVFLDVSQPLNKFWHFRMFYKTKRVYQTHSKVLYRRQTVKLYNQ